MNIVNFIKIEGLWNRRTPLEVRFDSEFNFLIGPNGTGKTTVINLLAAALTGDFERLDKIQYKKIIISLKPVSGRKQPSIEITKTQKKNLPYYDIEYIIKPSSTATPIKFDLDRYAEEHYYRGAPPRALRERIRQRFFDIQAQIREMLDVRWLSINRASEDLRPDDERRVYASAVDKKVSDLSNEIAKYFASLTKQYANATTDFQQESLLSVISAVSDFRLEEVAKTSNLDDERAALVKVFDLLKMSPLKYEKTLNVHIRNSGEAIKKFHERNPLQLSELGHIYSVYKAHQLVQQYKNLQEKRAQIFAPRDRFLAVLNELLAPRKSVNISDRDEIAFFTQNDRPMDKEDLSSGEKQLFIILGEALLQQSRAAVYIADEPELSLHITWQERLTWAIKTLNPRVQIIFATHSPDIVGSHSDKIIDMEQIPQ
jgi:predicted ATPase